jgi:hypothetical protein
MKADVTDTSEDAERMLIEVIRRTPVSKRLALVSDLIEATRALASADVRRRYPDATPDEVRRLLARRMLTNEEVVSVCGPSRDVPRG